MGVRSEIDLAPAQNREQEISSHVAHPAWEKQGRPSERQQVYEERAGDLADPARQAIEGSDQHVSPEEKPVPANVPRGVSGEDDRDRSRENASQQKLQVAEGKSKRADLAQDPRGGDPAEDLAADRQQRPQQAEKQRGGMFAGLKLNARPAPLQERGEASRMQRQPEGEGSLRPTPAQDRLAERARRQLPLEVAVDRYARAYQSIDQHRREGLPVLDMQRQEMRDAGQQLDQVRDGMKDLMRSTLQNDPATARAMTELSGRERVAHVIDGMKRENAALQDPNVRAERFVERWQELQGQRRELRGWRHDDARAKVESQMSGLAKSLERDPQAESLVRSRSRELGIGQELRRGQSIARELQDEMTRSRQLSRGIGLGR